MLTRVKWWFRSWFQQKKQIELMTKHIIVLQAQYKYLQQRIDRMEVPR